MAVGHRSGGATVQCRSAAVPQCRSVAAAQQLQQELALELQLEKEQEWQQVAKSLASNSSDVAIVTLNIGEQV